jgi:hypothetical protein
VQPLAMTHPSQRHARTETFMDLQVCTAFRKYKKHFRPGLRGRIESPCTCFPRISFGIIVLFSQLSVSVSSPVIRQTLFFSLSASACVRTANADMRRFG